MSEDSRGRTSRVSALKFNLLAIGRGIKRSLTPGKGHRRARSTSGAMEGPEASGQHTLASRRSDGSGALQGLSNHTSSTTHPEGASVPTSSFSPTPSSGQASSLVISPLDGSTYRQADSVNLPDPEAPSIGQGPAYSTDALPTGQGSIPQEAALSSHTIDPSSNDHLILVPEPTEGQSKLPMPNKTASRVANVGHVAVSGLRQILAIVGSATAGTPAEGAISAINELLALAEVSQRLPDHGDSH